MAVMMKYTAISDGSDKLLYACVLRRKGRLSRKSLIDTMLERSCILVTGMELHKSISKSEKTNPIF